MLDTIKININADNIMDMKKYAQDFIDYKSPKAGELHIQIVTKRKDNEGNIQDITFCSVFVQKIWNDYNHPEYVDHYDIIGNNLFVRNGLIVNISEDEVLPKINSIQETIQKNYNDEGFIKYYAASYFMDSRKYLYRGGQFCTKELEKLTDKHKKIYTRVCVLIKDMTSLINNKEVNIKYEESDIQLLNFLTYLLVDHCDENDIKIIQTMINNKNAYKIPQLVITSIFSSSASRTSIYNYSKEEQIVIKKAIHILRKYMKKNNIREQVKQKYFNLSTIIMVEKAKQLELLRQIKEDKELDRIRKAKQKRGELDA